MIFGTATGSTRVPPILLSAFTSDSNKLVLKKERAVLYAGSAARNGSHCWAVVKAVANLRDTQKKYVISLLAGLVPACQEELSKEFRFCYEGRPV
jgi:hypothetical protein